MRKKLSKGIMTQYQSKHCNSGLILYQTHDSQMIGHSIKHATTY